MGLRCGGRIPATTTASHSDPQRQGHSRPVLVKPAFNWGTHDRYVEFMNFEMEVKNILETKVYELTEDEKILMIKNGLDWESLQLIQTFTHG